MADFDYTTDNALSIIDTYLSTAGDYQGPFPLQTGFSEKFVEINQQQTQTPAVNVPIEVVVQSDQKQLQSNLHNCPKHLIKLIIQCVGLGKETAQEISKQFKDYQFQVYQNIRNLLGVLQLIRRNKLKSYSKQLLKIVFQNNSETIKRLKLLQNPLISQVFKNKNPLKMQNAKDILRQYAIIRLITRKDNYNDRSKNGKKDINEKYLQLFLEELKQGRIKQRISKEDKQMILN